MAKEKTSASFEDSDQNSFEIIELAIDDIDVLTRAFNLINEVCQQEDKVPQPVEAAIPKNLVN